MQVRAIVGSQWGDEGKGKLTDHFASEARVVMRFQGGCNAGHTLVHRGKRLALHMLPSGVLHEDVINVLGSGVALDCEQLRRELEALATEGIRPQLRISRRAHLVMPYHRERDVLEERRLGSRSFGSTRVGIAPCFGDKHLKIGITVADLLVPERYRLRLQHALELQAPLHNQLYGSAAPALDLLLKAGDELREWLAPRVCDTEALVSDVLDAGEGLLLEGQLGALRDPDQGTYPFVTSSSTLAAHACVTCAIPPRRLDRVTAVAKAYSSAVGAGPLPCEQAGMLAALLRERGHEYGATTGRPRRVGPFDAVATRHGARAQGADELAVTLLDVLDALEEVPICVGYDVDGELREDFPPTAELARAQPLYETLPGWGRSTRSARTLEALPKQARAYLERIAELVGTPIRWVSVGPERDAMFPVES
ncbi:MAG: adenylosuccinate synthase [Myxococcales bacterium]|jgi:adenylosuccinate synthase